MNNKGFAFSTMLYGFMIIGCLIFLVILGLMSTNRTNTREMINSIEDETRIVDANKTYTASENGKDYAEYFVPVGFSGWYKIELWGKGKYSAETVYLEGASKIRFFIGDYSTKDTYACSSSIWKGTSDPNPNGYDSEEDADQALEVNGVDIETVADCTSNSNQALILSTTSNGPALIKQIADDKGKKGNKFTIDLYKINNGINYKNGITTSLVKARVNLVSNAPATHTFASPNGCQPNHSGIYYIGNGVSPTAFKTYYAGSPPSITNDSLNGSRNQKWLIECKTANSCKIRSLADLNYELKPQVFSCSVANANEYLILAGY